MGDDDDGALNLIEDVFKPMNGVNIQVIRWLIEQ